VRSGGEVVRLCEELRQAGKMAVDLESNGFHAYRARLCLMQISDGTQAWLVDTLALDLPALQPLGELLANEGIEKVLHGADYDLRLLDREMGVTVRGLRDTQLAAQLCGVAAFGLASLLENELGVTLDKRFQRADFGLRPMSPELAAYAAADAVHLLELEERLRRRLDDLGRVGWWFEECAALEDVRWEETPPDPLAFARMRGASALRGVARDRLAALWAWREARAAAEDVPAFRVMQPETLLRLADQPPEDLAALAAFRGVGHGGARRHGRELLALMTSPPAAPDRRPVVPFVRDRECEDRIKRLKTARDEVAVGLSLDPVILAPRAVLEAVAEALPVTHDELVRCTGRRWRAEVLAPVVLPVCREWREG
jgi:ribonuclease D